MQASYRYRDIATYTNKAMDDRRLMLAVALFCQVWIAECQDNDGVSCNKTKIQEASIGRKFNITCTVVCVSHIYQWSNSTGQLLGETGAVLTVSERVESAAAVGGQLYVCQCREGKDTQCHLIQVTPFVKFDISTEVAKLASSVTFTCSAESYPPADNVDFFQLHHPSDHSIPQDQLSLDGTSVQYHVANASRSDGGEYDCVVSVPETPDGGHVQNRSSAYLTVYDPPFISETRSSAVVLSSAHGGGSAVLECVVENPETDLKVWVNWTSGSGDPLIGDDYVVGRGGGGVHFLVLHRVTKDKVHPYTCLLYSNYSPSVPEDHKKVNITVVDLQKCTETSGISKTEDCDCSTTVIAVSITLVAVIIAIIIINVVVAVLCRKCICRRKSELRVDRVDPRQEDGTVQNNPVFQNIELPVRDDIEEKSPTSVSPGPGEEGSEQLRTLAISNQNNASIRQSLSTQSTSSTTSTEEKGASVSGSVVHDTTDSQAIEITTTGGASMKEESHPPLSASPSKRKSLSDQMPPSPRVIASLGIGSGSGFGSTNPLIKENDEESDPDSDAT